MLLKTRQNSGSVLNYSLFDTQTGFLTIVCEMYPKKQPHIPNQ
uniref:Uncharacterized protein n=1 Tax=Anguilla anguilla TaxID=7936 RepID=A0A0E9RDI1_ANGAN